MPPGNRLQALLPAAAVALTPGGRLVFSTLAHYLNGAPAQPDLVAADILAKTPEVERASLRVLPAKSDAPCAAGTLLVIADR